MYLSFLSPYIPKFEHLPNLMSFDNRIIPHHFPFYLFTIDIIVDLFEFYKEEIEKQKQFYKDINNDTEINPKYLEYYYDNHAFSEGYLHAVDWQLLNNIDVDFIEDLYHSLTKDDYFIKLDSFDGTLDKDIEKEKHGLIRKNFSDLVIYISEKIFDNIGVEYNEVHTDNIYFYKILNWLLVHYMTTNEYIEDYVKDLDNYAGYLFLNRLILNPVNITSGRIQGFEFEYSNNNYLGYFESFFNFLKHGLNYPYIDNELNYLGVDLVYKELFKTNSIDIIHNLEISINLFNDPSVPIDFFHVHINYDLILHPFILDNTLPSMVYKENKMIILFSDMEELYEHLKRVYGSANSPAGSNNPFASAMSSLTINNTVVSLRNRKENNLLKLKYQTMNYRDLLERMLDDDDKE